MCGGSKQGSISKLENVKAENAKSAWGQKETYQDNNARVHIQHEQL